jgi:hypothetical protein
MMSPLSQCVQCVWLFHMVPLSYMHILSDLCLAQHKQLFSVPTVCGSAPVGPGAPTPAGSC